MPFGGAGNVEFALVRGAIRVTEKAAAEGRSLMQSQVLWPMVSCKLDQMARDE